MVNANSLASSHPGHTMKTKGKLIATRMVPVNKYNNVELWHILDYKVSVISEAKKPEKLLLSLFLKLDRTGLNNLSRKKSHGSIKKPVGNE